MAGDHRTDPFDRGHDVGVVVFFVVVTDAVDEAADEAFGDDGDYVVIIDGTRQTRDFEGQPALVVEFTFANNSDEPENFVFAATPKAYQDGVELEAAILDGNGSSNAMKDIKPGKSIVVQEAFILDDTGDVTIEVTEAFDLDEDVIVTETVTVEADDAFRDDFSEYDVTIDGSRQTKDYEGNPALLVDFTFTNNGDEPESFVFAATPKAYQNGVELEEAYLLESDSGNSMKNVKPGKSIGVQQAFVLKNKSGVTIEVTEAISLDEAMIASKTTPIR